MSGTGGGTIAPVPPGAAIGMLGGGQLGRMSILAGRRLGYRFRVFEPRAGSAAGMVADAEFNAAYDDCEALARFASGCAVVTLEFENVPAAAVEAVEAAGAPVRPGGEVLAICQNRRREKEFLRGGGFPCADFALAGSPEEAAAAARALGGACVLKSAAFGYDGKGQARLGSVEDAPAAWETVGARECVVEKWIPFERECSVICARNGRGQSRCFPMAENLHRHHILDTAIVPARVDEAVRVAGEELARAIAEALDVVGLIAVELFLMADGTLLVNELAPRPHNSGHASFDACVTSQFEQHVRAVCGLPLGDTALLRPAVMVNLLGGLWSEAEPEWPVLLADPGVKLHLYDKGAARPGRKMGHFTVMDTTVEAALARANGLRAKLTRQGD